MAQAAMLPGVGHREVVEAAFGPATIRRAS